MCASLVGVEAKHMLNKITEINQQGYLPKADRQ